MEGNIMDFKKLALQVTKIIDETPIADIHTHIYSEAFGDLLLWGIDELLTYHYLVAELFRYKPELDYEVYWSMPKQKQAELVWDELFVKNSPISESARGVVTVIDALGLDVSNKDLNKLRRYFAEIPLSQYIDKVFQLSNVKYVITTNDPFDAQEQLVWDKGANTDSRFKAALRIDGLFDPNCFANKNKALGTEFLKRWIEKIKPVYMAASLPPDFNIEDGGTKAKMILECILPAAREYNMPFAMMIGVKRAINPALRLAGDGVGKANVDTIAKLARDWPDVKFMVTMLSRENQHELCVTSRKFKNILVFGCWWFLNNPSIIREITTERIESLGLTMIPQHSDARVLDQLIYKWRHFRKIIAEVLTEKYFDLTNTGWPITEADIKRDVNRILGGQLL
ncbi:MAG: glucuronate isomerase [Phycisphaerae bacterium]|nr:glucuronate isomerase [Phycisphaerae bacterium]